MLQFPHYWAFVADKNIGKATLAVLRKLSLSQPGPDAPQPQRVRLETARTLEKLSNPITRSRP